MPNWPGWISPGNRSRLARSINSWVEERTEARIKDLIPPGVLDDRTRLVLTNAIYFKGDWTKPFDKGGDQGCPLPRHPRQNDVACR